MMQLNVSRKQEISVPHSTNFFDLDSESLGTTIIDIYKRGVEVEVRRDLSTSSTTYLTDPLKADIAKKWDKSQWIKHIIRKSEPVSINTIPNIAEDAGLQQHSTIELITYIRKQLQLPFSERLAERLSYLVDVSEEDDEVPMSPQSLYDFIRYLEYNHSLAYPNVVLTSPGNIRAQWRKVRDQHFAVEFLGNGDVRFVVFAPDPKRPDKIDRVTGLVCAESLMELVQPYGVLKWACIAEVNE